MLRRPLGSTGFQVSELGFGCWQLGGEGWGKVSAREAATAVEKGLELGVNLFDTAPVYGFGRSEELLGKILRASRRGGDAIVVTKGGLTWDDRGRIAHDARAQSLRSQLEDSLRRLRRSAADVYLLHWPDPAVPLAETVEGLEVLRREGKLRSWGVSNHALADVDRLAPYDPVLEYPVNCLGEHAVDLEESARAARAWLARAAQAPAGGPAAQPKGSIAQPNGFLAFDALARGALAGAYAPDTRFGKRDVRSRDARYSPLRFPRLLARAEALRSLARRAGTSPAVLALSAVLEMPGVSACLAGMKTPQYVAENAAASGWRIPPDVKEALQSL